MPTTVGSRSPRASARSSSRTRWARRGTSRWGRTAICSSRCRVAQAVCSPCGTPPATVKRTSPSASAPKAAPGSPSATPGGTSARRPPPTATRAGTGIRNAGGLAIAASGELYATQHGRDQLGQNWSKLFTLAQSAEKPSEEFIKLSAGDDYGWPYCYHDPELGHLVLAPEYGGDGKTVGRCKEKKEPLVAFPAHWAPDGLVFYRGTQFPARYRDGAFIAFHGSWNRAPLPQAGYRIVFVPFKDGKPVGTYDTFADGFWHQDGAGPQHRPVGVAVGPGGSLYITDDAAGRIWRVLYKGGSGRGEGA